MSFNRFTQYLENPAKASRLKHLELWGAGLGDEQAVALASAPHFDGLESLQLGCNQIGPAGFAALWKGALNGGLRGLFLFQNRLSHQGIEVLQEATAPGLSALNVCCNGLGPGSAEILAGVSWERLACLHLGYNQLCDAGAATLASLSSGAPLEELNIKLNHLGPLGLKALLCGPGWGGLKRLFLEQNPLGFRGIPPLVEAPAAATLELLHLGDTRIGMAGLELLCCSPRFTALKELYLDFNGLDASALDTLRRAPFFGQLTHLRLAGNPIPDDALAAFCTHTGATLDAHETLRWERRESDS